VSEAHGGIHVGNVAGNVAFSALGDIVGGDKIVVNTTIQISIDAVRIRPFVAASPYRGLNRFDHLSRTTFFGRDEAVAKLVRKVEGAPTLLVLGASGSGKSSLVRAGLLPELTARLGTPFRYFSFVPDVNPFESLRSSFVSAGFSQRELEELSSGDAERAIATLTRLRKKGEQWLLFVDQFEEIFTRTPEPLRKQFLDFLLGFSRERDNPQRVALAMRADFVERLAPFPEFARRVESNIEIVADMTKSELRLAIEQPAAQHGVVYEPGLTEEIIDAVVGQPGYLPLLQYALDLLWQEHPQLASERTLRASVYREIGGATGALQRRAETVFSEQLSSVPAAAGRRSDQEVARHVFLQLVDITSSDAPQGVPFRPVRRRVAKSDLVGAGEDEVLQTLIDEKLVVSDRSTSGEGTAATVEIAHEALFLGWARYKDWVASAVRAIFFRNRLADDAERWQRARQKDSRLAEDELWSGSRLTDALELQAAGDFKTIASGLGERETTFLDASVARRDTVASAEAKARQRSIRLLVGGLVVALGLLSLSLYGLQLARQRRLEADAARNQEHEAKQRAEGMLVELTARSLFGIAQALPDDATNRTVRTLLAVQSLKTGSSFEAFQLLAQQLGTLPPREERGWDAGQTIRAIAMSESGRSVATTDDAALIFWADGKEAKRFRTEATADEQSRVAVSASGQWLAWWQGRRLRIWDSSDWREQRIDDVGQGMPRTLDFTGDDFLVVRWEGDFQPVEKLAQARLYEFDGDWRPRFDMKGNIWSISSDSRARHVQVVTAELGGEVRLWDWQKRALRQRVLWDKSGGTVALADGRLALNASRRVEHWRIDKESPRLDFSFDPAEGTFLSTRAAFAGYGRYLVYTDAGRAFEGNKELKGFADDLHPLASSRHAYEVVGVRVPERYAHGRRVTVRSLHSPRREMAKLSTISARRVAFLDDGKALASCGYQEIDVFDAAAASPAARPSWKELASVRVDACESLAASPRGRMVASWSEQKLTLFDWGLAQWSDTPASRSADLEEPIRGVLFSNGEEALAVLTQQSVRFLTTTKLEATARLTVANLVTVRMSPDAKYVHLLTSVECSESATLTSVREISTGKEVASTQAECPGKARTETGDAKLLSASYQWPQIEVLGSYLSKPLDDTWELTLSSRASDDDRGLKVTRNQRVLPLVEHEGGKVVDAAFSPDGRWLVTVADNESPRVWALRDQDVIAEACSRLDRNLTQLEWRTHVGTAPYQATCENFPPASEAPR
jgi:WD40 repeat protein